MNENKNTSGFDLTAIPTEDLDALSQKIETYYKNDTTQKTQLSYHWERNALMLDGKQWLVYDGTFATGGIWKQLDVSAANDYIPRPVTNYMFDIYQTLKAYLIKVKPRSSIYPNTREYNDIVAAKIAEICVEANYERLKEAENYETAASHLVAYGTVFKKDYWDTSNSNTKISVPRETIDELTGLAQPEIDPMTGEQMMDEYVLGDINTDIIEPYRIALDPLASDIHKARWIMEYSIHPLDWIKETYGKMEDGYTGRVDEVKPENALQGSLKRLYNLKSSSGVQQQLGVPSQSGASGEEKLENVAVVKEYYEAPSLNYPKGRLIVVANGIPLYAGESPYSGPDLGDWHPYSECRWEIVPNRFWGKSPLDAASMIQKQINSIDATIILTRKTMAVPQKLIPMAAGITHGSWTGRPGQHVFYRETGGAKPEIIQGAGVDQTVFQERAQKLEDIKTVTGAIDILKGDNPTGVTAASALEMLYEVGTGKIYPVLDRWRRFIESSQKKQLRLIASHYKEPREQFIKLLQRFNKELSKSTLDKFIGEDLLDNVNVVIETAANVTKLQAAKKQELREAAQVGILGLEDPKNRAEYQRQMGIEGFDSDAGPDVKRAQWENAMLKGLMQSPDNRPVVLDCDNHDIHIAIHQLEMKQPSFFDLPPEIQQAYMMHIQEHEQMKAMKEQAAQLQAMAMGMPAQPIDGNAPRPVKAAGKGPTTDAKDALNTDLNVPGAR